jgi:hypothetical protein
MAFVKIKNFPSRMMAEEAQQNLEQEGIPSLIQSPDMGIIGGGGGASGLPQGADLYVPEERKEEALPLILSIFNGL